MKEKTATAVSSRLVNETLHSTPIFSSIRAKLVRKLKILFPAKHDNDKLIGQAHNNSEEKSNFLQLQKQEQLFVGALKAESSGATDY